MGSLTAYKETCPHPGLIQIPFPSSQPSCLPKIQIQLQGGTGFPRCPRALLSASLSIRAQPSSKHWVFWGKLPRKPNVTWPTGCVLQVGPREASASLSESSHPRRGSARRWVPSAKRAQPFSSNAGGSTKALLLSSLLKRRGINLLLFLPNDTPESYRALAMQLSITGSQGGAKSQGKPMEAQGKYITPGLLRRAQPSGEQIGVQVERFIWGRLQPAGNHNKADK